MPVQHQLPYIPILRSRDPDAGEVIFQHQLEKMLGIPPVVLLLAHPLGSDLRRIALLQLIVELREQALEPTRVPGGLHPDAHADSFFLQPAVELLGLPTAVCQPPLSALSSFPIHPCDLLYARVIIATSFENASRVAVL
jgi:hypothetical protein